MTHQQNPPQDPAPAPRRVNRIRERLAAGDYVLGLTITTNNLETAVLGAKLGFHFLWVEMEHSPVSLESLRSIVLATSELECAVIARVPVVELWTAKRVLDQGVSGVIFPFVGDAAMARTAAAACRYPPRGLRGSGAGLAASTWFGEGNYCDSADSQMLTVCVVEDKNGLDQIDAIAATPDVDVIFIGTSDLSFSLGLRGRQDDPLLRDAIGRIRSAAQRHHKYLGRPAVNAEDLNRYHAEGFQFFQSVTELGLMRLGAEMVLGPLGITQSSIDNRPLY
jgi:2-keto-3-deoxy-L-rhamnonate aldolase RhmA